MTGRAVGHGEQNDMSKKLLIVIGLALVLGYALGFLYGRHRGHSSGFMDGLVWGGHTAAGADGVCAVALLTELGRKNYSRVGDLLDGILDQAIVRVMKVQEQLARVDLPREMREEVERIQTMLGVPTGVDESAGYKLLAEFRHQHPTSSESPYVREAVSDFVARYR